MAERIDKLRNHPQARDLDQSVLDLLEEIKNSLDDHAHRVDRWGESSVFTTKPLSRSSKECTP